MSDPLADYAKRAFPHCVDFYLAEIARPFLSSIEGNWRIELWRINYRLDRGMETPEMMDQLKKRRAELFTLSKALA